MATLVIKSNPSTTSPVLIPDVGVEVASGGGSVTLEGLDALWQAAQSNDLLNLAQDDAFGVGSSTLILNDGTADIDQDLADEFLATVFIDRLGPYSVVVRDDAEDLGLSADEIDYDPTNSGLSALEVQSAIDEIVSGGASGIDEAAHEELDTLAHWLVEDGYSEATYDSFGRVTSVIAYTDTSKTLKIREEQGTFLGLSRRINERVLIQYDGLGAEVYRLTTTYTYDGLRVLSAVTVRS